MKRFVTAMVLLGSALLIGSGACGGDNNGGDDGGTQDGTLQDVIDTDGGGGGDGSCWNGCDGGTCTPLGIACQASSDCCSNHCVGGSCQPPTCTSDNQACTTNAQCCGGTCGSNGTCTPLTTCKTLGNACASGGECCSQFCLSGICSQPSFCGQNGDICTQGSDCCGGVCTKQPNATFGLCGQPSSGGCDIDGVICQGALTGDGGVILTDGGIPQCGGSCCSRACAPWGPTQVLVCQPSSGCKPVGDVCASTADCCGGQGQNPTQVCNKKNANDPVGVCSNPTGCKPNGDICRLQSNQCNATDNCCSGNVQQFDTCKQDSLGVPRCSYPGDAGCIAPASDAGCASSADCCNLNPCVPDGNGGFTCYPTTCVPASGACTTDADCCPGGHCYIQSGHTSGTCIAPDAGVTDSGPPPCSLYGQTCSQSSDCCNNVPCTNGRCVSPQPN